MEKSIKFLIDYYMKHQFVPPTKGGLITGDPKCSTYKLVLNFDKSKNKLRYDLKDFFENSDI